MSHAITVTRTTTTTASSTAIIINTGYLSTLPGVLKLLHTVINSVCVGLIAYYYDNRTYYSQNKELFFFLIAVAFLIGSAVLLLSCLLSLGTATVLPKTVFDYLYHSTGFILYLIASVFLLIAVSDRDSRYSSHSGLMAAAILGLINAGLYLFAAILSYRTYKYG